MISFIITLIILVFVAISIFKFTKPTKKKEYTEQDTRKVPTPPIKVINQKYIGGYRRVYYIVDNLEEVYKATISTLSQPFDISIYTFIGGNITYEQYAEETQN